MDLFETKPFFLVGTFVFKQFIAVENSLHCRIAVIFFLSFWDCFQKVSADMYPATAPFGFFYLIVTLIAISHEVETGFYSIQKLFGIFTRSCGGIIVENDRI